MSRMYLNKFPPPPRHQAHKAGLDLGLKRALKEAAEGGYEKLIWTACGASGAILTLSKQIDRLVYNPDLRNT